MMFRLYCAQYVNVRACINFILLLCGFWLFDSLYNHNSLTSTTIYIIEHKPDCSVPLLNAGCRLNCTCFIDSLTSNSISVLWISDSLVAAPVALSDDAAAAPVWPFSHRSVSLFNSSEVVAAVVPCDCASTDSLFAFIAKLLSTLSLEFIEFLFNCTFFDIFIFILFVPTVTGCVSCISILPSSDVMRIGCVWIGGNGALSSTETITITIQSISIVVCLFFFSNRRSAFSMSSKVIYSPLASSKISTGSASNVPTSSNPSSSSSS